MYLNCSGGKVYIIRNVLVPISKEIDINRELAHKLTIPIDNIISLQVLRRSLDARKKNNLKFNYTLLVDLKKKPQLNSEVLRYTDPKPYHSNRVKLSNPHPFIIGAGPAGLFSALALVEKGFQPYIFDRGETIELRAKKVNKFWKDGILDENSNVQFGEGGAGTFSDGKLTSRTRDYYINKIIDYLIRFGADESIKYEALPHLGTDGLRIIIKNIRTYLIDNGCKFYWNKKLESIKINKGKLSQITIDSETFSPEILILAIGNSSRDTFTMLADNIEMESKSFALGFRIEHTQEFINNSFFGDKTDLSITGPASYRLAAKYKDKGIYSFCMCPGGYVIAGSSEKNSLVLNGMSYNARSKRFANSAIVATVNKNDFGEEVLSGMNFQRSIEKKCFNNSKPFFAPAEHTSDFVNSTNKKNITDTSYIPGIIRYNLNTIFPKNITNAIQFGLNKFNNRIPGFIDNSILMAPETRTSSPVRIVRDKITFESLSLTNLYPVGEGSGYAGGIMSSAADGFKCGLQFHN